MYPTQLLWLARQLEVLQWHHTQVVCHLIVPSKPRFEFRRIAIIRSLCRQEN